MTEKKEYLWRPNDTSAKTNLRYNLEMGHWMDSWKENVPNTTSFGEFFGFFGLLLSFIINIIHFIVLILIELVKWVMKVWPKKKVKPSTIPTFKNRKRLTGPEMRELITESRKSGIIEEMFP